MKRSKPLSRRPKKRKAMSVASRVPHTEFVNAKGRNLREQLALMSAPDPSTGCLIWTRSTDKKGYGSCFWNGSTRRAPRLAWELENGPIPPGLSVLHNCPAGDNTRCINPAHLWLGTHDDNMADKVRKGRQAYVRGEKQGTSKLTDQAVEAIRADARDCVSIAREHGVTPEAVRLVKRRITWAHIP